MEWIVIVYTLRVCLSIDNIYQLVIGIDRDENQNKLFT